MILKSFKTSHSEMLKLGQVEDETIKIKIIRLLSLKMSYKQIYDIKIL